MGQDEKSWPFLFARSGNRRAKRCDAKMKRKIDTLSFEVVEVPPPEGSLDALLDFIADLLVRKWMEEREDEDARCSDLRSSNNPS